MPGTGLLNLEQVMYMYFYQMDCPQRRVNSDVYRSVERTEYQLIYAIKDTRII